MGLDACVYCDCFESGKLKKNPPELGRVFVMDDGGLACRCDDLQQSLMFDRWRRDACPHRDGILLQHHLGNVALIAALRLELEKESLPILLSQVIQTGMHAGDYLDLETVLKLENEVASLSGVVVRYSEVHPWLGQFQAKLSELIDAAKLVRKPIAF